MSLKTLLLASFDLFSAKRALQFERWYLKQAPRIISIITYRSGRWCSLPALKYLKIISLCCLLHCCVFGPFSLQFFWSFIFSFFAFICRRHHNLALYSVSDQVMRDLKLFKDIGMWSLSIFLYLVILDPYVCFLFVFELSQIVTSLVYYQNEQKTHFLFFFLISFLTF